VSHHFCRKPFRLNVAPLSLYPRQLSERAAFKSCSKYQHEYNITLILLDIRISTISWLFLFPRTLSPSGVVKMSQYSFPPQSNVVQSRKFVGVDKLKFKSIDCKLHIRRDRREPDFKTEESSNP